MRDKSDWDGGGGEGVGGEDVAIGVGGRAAASAVGIGDVGIDAEWRDCADTLAESCTPDHSSRAGDGVNASLHAFAALRALVVAGQAGNGLALAGAGVGVEVLVGGANQ